MEKNLLLIGLLCFFHCGISTAQTLTPFVVSSSGGFYSNGAGMLSFTTAEMSAVETYTASAVILTQGFQQSWDFGTSIYDHPSADFRVIIYPNPSAGNFSIETDAGSNKQISIKIMDVTGRLFFQKNYYHQQRKFIQPIDLSDASQGVYMIVFSAIDLESGQPNHFVQKINIVR